MKNALDRLSAIIDNSVRATIFGFFLSLIARILSAKGGFGSLKLGSKICGALSLISHDSFSLN
jgi:hypothetical protein